MKIMPEKDPTFWVLVLAAFRDNALAMGLTAALIWLRIQYDGKETKPWRQLIEAVLGAFLVMVVGLTVKAFGLSPGWSFFAAGFVGILGVDHIRQLGRRWSERKAESLP
ncbi:phage holin, lambda family [Pseudomonas yamanorum]|uniref:phage holin, lambda family n=1 Tax=Pseudomonas yamanorum TaxID=515393 RepID=UPI002ED4E1A4|nr:phage holin, lambda family [Pseudomonas yamanorum]